MPNMDQPLATAMFVDRENSARVALEAGLWYNGRVKYCCGIGALATLLCRMTSSELRRLATMDIVRPNPRNRKNTFYQHTDRIFHSPQEGIIKIVTRSGVVALIDEVDAELAQAKWWYREGYAVREVLLGHIMGKRIHEIEYMHRVVMENMLDRCLREDEYVDHIDGDRMNNRRSNLRLSTKLQNRLNSRKRGDKTSSQYKGVSWHKHEQKWQARITVNKKVITLGYFTSEKVAALAYNDAAKKHFGEFASLNEVPPI